jgi:hypothetical protein
MVESLVDLLAELLVLVRLGLLVTGNVVNHLKDSITRNTGYFLSWIYADKKGSMH